MTGFKHGLSKTPENRAWRRMKSRCNTPSKKQYQYYKGRGITYDPRWETFLPFLEDMGLMPKEPGYSLDRINNDLGYSKENCRWATAQQQSLNRRPHKPHIDRGVAKCHPECKHFAFGQCKPCYDVDYRPIKNLRARARREKARIDADKARYYDL